MIDCKMILSECKFAEVDFVIVVPLVVSLTLYCA